MDRDGNYTLGRSRLMPFIDSNSALRADSLPPTSFPGARHGSGTGEGDATNLERLFTTQHLNTRPTHCARSAATAAGLFWQRSALARWTWVKSRTGGRGVTATLPPPETTTIVAMIV